MEREVTALAYVPLRKSWLPNFNPFTDRQEEKKPIVKVGYVIEPREVVLGKLYEYHSVFKYSGIVLPIDLACPWGFSIRTARIDEQSRTENSYGHEAFSRKIPEELLPVKSIDNLDLWKIEQDYCDAPQFDIEKVKTQRRIEQTIHDAIRHNGKHYFSVYSAELNLKEFLDHWPVLEELRQEKLPKGFSKIGKDRYNFGYDIYTTLRIPSLIEIGIATGLIQDRTLEALVSAVYQDKHLLEECRRLDLQI